MLDRINKAKSSKVTPTVTPTVIATPAVPKKILVARKLLLSRRILEKVLSNLDYSYESLTDTSTVEAKVLSHDYDILFY
ncbi:MAG: hypothetical protein Q9M36_07115 [Sulfurovum sp.]|nr:hypothetical protein [Sulfurovum sp.]